MRTQKQERKTEDLDEDQVQPVKKGLASSTCKFRERAEMKIWG